MKCYNLVKQGKKLAGTCSYLNDFAENKLAKCEAKILEELKEWKTLLQIFAHRSARLVFETGQSLDECLKKGLTLQQAWNFHLSDFIKLNEAHCSYLFLQAFIYSLQHLTDPSLVKVLSPLCALFAFVKIEEKSGDLLIDGFLSGEQGKLVAKGIKLLLQEIRPNAISLVDSFAFSDFYLNSSLGKYDGRVYEDLFERAKHDPLNTSEVSEAYTLHLSRLLKGKVFSNL